jgi:branched-chain amino acid transport system ATP-binding protein
MPEILRLEEVSATYGKIAVLHDVSFTLDRSSTLAIVGANGSGKTTLLRVLLGQIPCVNGRISLDGRPLGSLPTFRRARLGIGYAPEGRQLFPQLSVRENLELGGYMISARQRSSKIDEMLEIFPKLQVLVNTHCVYLSGGEQQMVTIARALMSSPRLLVLDEPSTGLAPRVVSELYLSLRALLSTGLTILVAEQNARAALNFAMHAIVLEDGHVVARGTSASLKDDPKVMAAYVGHTGGATVTWREEADDRHALTK